MSYLQGNKITNIDAAEAASPTMVFAFAKKAARQRQAKSSKCLNATKSVTTADLRNDGKVLAWFQSEAHRKARSSSKLPLATEAVG